jgi:hypothetical protein
MSGTGIRRSLGAALLAALAATVLGCSGTAPGAPPDGGPADGVGVDSTGGGDANTDAATDPAAPSLTVEPSSGSAFGHYEVTVTVPALDGGLEGDVVLSIGQQASPDAAVGQPVQAYNLQIDGNRISATVQGAPLPGPADVVVEVNGTELRRAQQAFTYAPPVTSQVRWLAMGASITQGIQSGGISTASQLYSPASQVARAAGAYLGLPLAKDGLIPPLSFDDFNPDCSLKPGADQIDALAILQLITDPMTHRADLRRARVDATLQDVRDVAVGGSKIDEVINGPSDMKVVIANAIEDPGTTQISAQPLTQLEWAERLQPELVISADLYVNDIVPAIFASDNDFVLDQITPRDQFFASVDEFLARISAAAGQVFLANSPHLDYVVRVKIIHDNLIAGGATEDEFQQKLAAFNAIIDDYNAGFMSKVAAYQNISVMDFAGLLDSFIQGGKTVGGQQLTTEHFGGLVSLDDFHPTNTGYALIGNELITLINQKTGASIPSIDVDQVFASDPLSPMAIRAAGFTCVP